jgi:Superoxide dismutase
VDNLNKAEFEMVKLREYGDYSFISYWNNQLAFNGGGHTLHSILWANLDLLTSQPQNIEIPTQIWYNIGNRCREKAV